MTTFKPPVETSLVEESLQAPSLVAFCGKVGLLWLFLTLLGLMAGLAWRATGSGPGPFQVLSGIGLALGAASLIFSQAWSDLQRRQMRHTPGPNRTRTRLVNAVVFWLGSLLVSLAPLGAFMAFDMRQPVALVITDSVNFPISLGLFTTAVLALCGPPLICLLSVWLFLAWRWLGLMTGVICWLAGVMALNFSLFSGANPGGLPLSFGEMALRIRDWLNEKNMQPAVTVYLSDLVQNAAVYLFFSLLAVMLLLFVCQFKPARYRRRLDITWISALAATAIVAIRAGWLAEAWVTAEGARFPGAWTEAFDLGVIALCVVYYLLSQTFAGSMPRGAANRFPWWLVPCPALWVLCTTPNLAANQATQVDVLACMLISAELILLWLIGLKILALPDLASFPIARVVLGSVVICLLVVPISGLNTTTMVLLQRLTAGVREGWQSLETRLLLVMLALMLWVIYYWTYRRWRPPARQH